VKRWPWRAACPKMPQHSVRARYGRGQPEHRRTHGASGDDPYQWRRSEGDELALSEGVMSCGSMGSQGRRG